MDGYQIWLAKKGVPLTKVLDGITSRCDDNLEQYWSRRTFKDTTRREYSSIIEGSRKCVVRREVRAATVEDLQCRDKNETNVHVNDTTYEL